MAIIGSDAGCYPREGRAGDRDWSGVGIVIGVLAALCVGGVLSGYLYAISASDPLTFVTVSALLAAVVIGASYLPARRATLIDPLEALRRE